MKRGQIWRYTPALARPGQPLLRLIVSTDAVNDGDLPVVLALHVVTDDPVHLLAAPVGGHGWARALTIEAVTRRRLIEHVGDADVLEMDQVAVMLRAALDI